MLVKLIDLVKKLMILSYRVFVVLKIKIISIFDKVDDGDEYCEFLLIVKVFFIKLFSFWI